MVDPASPLKTRVPLGQMCAETFSNPLPNERGVIQGYIACCFFYYLFTKSPNYLTGRTALRISGPRIADHICRALHNHNHPHTSLVHRLGARSSLSDHQSSDAFFSRPNALS